MVSQFGSQTSDANLLASRSLLDPAQPTVIAGSSVKVEALLFRHEGRAYPGVVRRANERRPEIEPLPPLGVSEDLLGP
jgi:hypothetical protein